jgi:hypothetical protein
MPTVTEVSRSVATCQPFIDPKAKHVGFPGTPHRISAMRSFFELVP